MEAYLCTRLYHQAITKWYTTYRERDDRIRITDFSTSLAALFVSIFKTYSHQVILLVASDGRITSINTMTDPAPVSFRTRRYMKIDNKSAISSIHHVIAFLYQLLSIEIEQDTISLLDASGLVQFTMNVMMENECDSTEWTRFIQKQLFRIPPFVSDREQEWKTLRDMLLNQVADHKDLSEIERIQHHETLLEKVNACHRMIQTLTQTITLQEERISWLEEKMILQ